ncbi:MAG: Asp/Glu/hydantoin racemase [Gammaproteobacteria bacterium]
MTIYHSAGSSPSWTGQDIGIMVLDCQYPFVRGNVANAQSYQFPVRYAEVKGASIERLLYEGDASLLGTFVDAARQLQNEGVRAITGACGFMAQFQKELQEAVGVPVFSSSLLQIPYMYALTGKPVGVITADATCLKAAHFRACDVPQELPVAIAGMDLVAAFKNSVLANAVTLDNDAVKLGAVKTAVQLQKDNPAIGSILLECSDLPPYAKDIQRATGLPVFDFITMIENVHRAFNPPQFG